MRKARIILIAIIVLVIFVSGCTHSSSSIYDSEWATDPSGNRVLVYEGSFTTFPDNLPADIQYNDSFVTVEKITFYQNSPKYSYNLFMVVTLNVSELDDSQIHWLRESDLDVIAYLTNEKNDYDFDRMSPLGSLLVEDQHKIHFVFTSSFLKENRYTFAGSEITLAIDLKQEETYEYVSSKGDSYDKNVVQALHYTVAVPDSIPEAETIPQPLYKYVAEWLNDKAEFYQSLS